MIRPKRWSKGDLTILAEEQLFQSRGTSSSRSRTGGKGLQLQREGIRLDVWKDILIEMVFNTLERIWGIDREAHVVVERS